MKRLWPGSLAGQIALAVALALLLAQAINLGLLFRERERQLLTQVSAPAIARLADAIERDAAGEPLPRGRMGRAGRRGLSIGTASRVTPAMIARPDIAARARAALSEIGLTTLALEAGQAARVPDDRFARLRAQLNGRDRPMGPYLIVSAQVAPNRWITSIARLPRRNAPFTGWLIFQTLLFYALVLIPVLWLVRRLARPLGTLTTAVESFRDAGSGSDVPESGPADIRRLIAAHNAMRARIAALLDEKDRMLGAIGHDLRTPLASLRVRAEGVEDEAERQRMAETIEEMNRTLDDILSLARLGRPREQATRVDLAALLEQIVDDFDMLGADVTLAEAGRTTLAIRPTLITRAVRNLIDNAVKYGGAARVSLEREGNGIAIVIDDSGPGIPPAQIEAMFEPFARLEQSRNRETGGSGLGLALAKAIARQHDGKLTLANRTEGGLSARLWLPG